MYTTLLEFTPNRNIAPRIAPVVSHAKPGGLSGAVQARGELIHITPARNFIAQSGQNSGFILYFRYRRHSVLQGRLSTAGMWVNAKRGENPCQFDAKSQFSP